LIHQFWVGERKPGMALQQCKDVHTGWQYQLWNQETFLEQFPSDTPDVGMPVFDGSHGKLINQDLYDRPGQPPNLLSDIMRFEVVMLLGGVYIDADSECLRPLDHFIKEMGNAQGFGFLEKDEAYVGGLVASGFIGMFPLSPLAITLVSQLQNTDWSLPPWQSAGPLYFTKVLHWFRDLPPEFPEYLRVHTFASHHVYPYHHSDSRPDDYLHQLTHKGAIADQKWGTTHGNYQTTEWITQHTAPSKSTVELLENYVHVHKQGLSAAAVRRPRWVVASLHPHAGACNRMMHIVSCLAFAMATGRTLLFDWDETVTEKHANGIEDMGHTSFQDLFQVCVVVLGIFAVVLGYY
jgi:inositol phosphorylceramide mannosyltransferase catalytic subunit